MATQRLTFDPIHSGVHFTVRHMMISKVRGAFDRWEGTIDFDDKDLAASQVSVRIEAASIDTRETDRDVHLRSADFLDVEKHPALTFQSTKVEKGAGNAFRVTGDLMIHGVTRPVVLEAETLGTGKDPWGNERVGFEAHTAINRKDFGLNWNQTLDQGGLLLGERIDIALEVQAIKPKAS